jgi:hypothetical protein
MHGFRLDRIMQRLDPVERANRWWKAASLIAIALLSVVMLLGATGRQEATRAEELRVARLILIDEGRPLGRLGIEPGRPGFSFLDDSGTLVWQAHGSTPERR